MTHRNSDSNALRSLEEAIELRSRCGEPLESVVLSELMRFLPSVRGKLAATLLGNELVKTSGRLACVLSDMLGLALDRSIRDNLGYGCQWERIEDSAWHYVLEQGTRRAEYERSGPRVHSSRRRDHELVSRVCPQCGVVYQRTKLQERGGYREQCPECSSLPKLAPGIARSTYRARIKAGWDPERAANEVPPPRDSLPRNILEIARAHSLDPETVRERIRKGWDAQKAASEPTLHNTTTTPELRALAKSHGVSVGVLGARIRLGWDAHRAATTPVGKVRRTDV
jgi:predicted RNA-binding Zn-ribbon protein involved in translation (DUF1610 family)